MATALLGVLTIGTPAARAQSAVEYALIVAQIAALGLNDTTPPTITINTPADGAIYAPGQPVNADYGCNDAGLNALTALAATNGLTLDQVLAVFADNGFDLGHPVCSGPVPSGAAINTLPGPHDFTVNAGDVGFAFVDTNADGVPDKLVQHSNTSTLTHQ
jgi:hypothetical protein